MCLPISESVHSVNVILHTYTLDICRSINALFGTLSIYVYMFSLSVCVSFNVHQSVYVHGECVCARCVAALCAKECVRACAWCGHGVLLL